MRVSTVLLCLPIAFALTLIVAGCESRAAAPGTAPQRPATPPSTALARAAAPWLTLRLGAPIGGFERPVHVVAAHDGTKRIFVVEQAGRVRVVEPRGSDGGALLPTPFVDVADALGGSSGERGLLGLAFHPRYKDNGRLFIGYTDDDGNDAYAELRANATRTAAERASLRVLFAIEDFAGNHNGGHVLFGPDGRLWLGTGDGGGGGDPKRTAQDPASLLGKMLVLDVDALPARGAARPETRFIGLRNPWRYAFDAATGDLWIADVGQNRWEEVHVVDKARLSERLDFGWSKVEAAHCFRPGDGCDASGTEPVVFEYAHSGADGCSITGGVVFRSEAEPFADGTYIVGDHCSGRVWMIKRAGADFVFARALDTGKRISSFGTDESGAVWLVDHAGFIHRVHAEPVATAPVSPTPAPPPSPSPLPPARG